MPAFAAAAGLTSPVACAVSRGSGRRNTNRTTATATNRKAERTNGVASVGTPHGPNQRPVVAERFGPATPPMVVAHTMSERCRPYDVGGARSTAAKRAWL